MAAKKQESTKAKVLGNLEFSLELTQGEGENWLAKAKVTSSTAANGEEINLGPLEKMLFLEMHRLNRRKVKAEFVLSYLKVGKDYYQLYHSSRLAEADHRTLLPAAFGKADLTTFDQAIAALCAHSKDEDKCPPNWSEAGGHLYQEVCLEWCRETPEASEKIFGSLTFTLIRDPIIEFACALPRPIEFERGAPMLQAVENAEDYIILGSRAACEEPLSGAKLNAGVWRALECLNDPMRSEKAVALITGPPGCGKEFFARSVHSGSLRSDRKWLTAAVAGLTMDDLRRILYGADADGHHERGLIEDAKDSSLFLDEFEKVEEVGFYGNLLRVLEAEKFMPRNSIRLLEVENLRLIFAGANVSLLKEKAPEDLWSRLSHHIEIDNPVLAAEDDAQGYAAALVLLTIFKSVSKRLKLKPIHLLEEGSEGQPARGWVRSLLFAKDSLPIQPARELFNLAMDIARAALVQQATAPRMLRQAGGAAARVLVETVARESKVNDDVLKVAKEACLAEAKRAMAAGLSSRKR